MAVTVSIDPRWIVPDWPVPPHVRAAFSLRQGGVSQGPWASLNLATHVNDDPAHVAQNRHRLGAALGLPGEPFWLNQVHGTDVLCLDDQPPQGAVADASWTAQAGRVCAVMVADCLPVLFCDTRGRFVAAAHAGWRGLCDGVLEQTLARLRQAAPDAEWLAWLGPCIGPAAFEVGAEVREAFLARDVSAETAFQPAGSDRWRADLQQLARRRLAALEVARIYAISQCTFSDSGLFYSYRREGVCGRMAALIWRS